MNQEQKELIQKILASQNKQLQVDAIKKVEEQKASVTNPQKAIEVQKMHLVTMNKEKYLLDEEKQREEKKRYTQTFREALKEDQKEKEEQRRRIVEQRRKLEEKEQKEKKEYTQTFREALKEEQQKKEEEKRNKRIANLKQQRKTEKAMQAYQMQEMVTGEVEYEPTLLEKIRILFTKFTKVNDKQENILVRHEQFRKNFMESLQTQVDIADSEEKITQNNQEKEQRQKEER